jgi:hypothetical protein
MLFQPILVFHFIKCLKSLIKMECENDHDLNNDLEEKDDEKAMRYPEDYYEKMIYCLIRLQDYSKKNNLGFELKNKNMIEDMFKLCNLRYPIYHLESVDYVIKRRH